MLSGLVAYLKRIVLPCLHFLPIIGFFFCASDPDLGFIPGYRFCLTLWIVQLVPVVLLLALTLGYINNFSPISSSGLPHSDSSPVDNVALFLVTAQSVLLRQSMTVTILCYFPAL